MPRPVILLLSILCVWMPCIISPPPSGADEAEDTPVPLRIDEVLERLADGESAGSVLDDVDARGLAGPPGASEILDLLAHGVPESTVAELVRVGVHEIHLESNRRAREWNRRVLQPRPGVTVITHPWHRRWYDHPYRGRGSVYPSHWFPGMGWHLAADACWDPWRCGVRCVHACRIRVGLNATYW